LHTGSLSVEEQFYLGYPFLLVFLRRIPKSWTIVLLLGMSVVSFGLSQWGVQHKATFYLLPTRAWELLIGGLICFIPAPTRLKDWHLGLLSALGIAGILIAGWAFTSSTPFPGMAALLPCGGAALLIYANSLRLTWVGRVLATRPVVFVGLISYSLYLWHWPILAFLRYWLGARLEVWVGALALAATFPLALLSWRFVEQAFRRPKHDAVARAPFAMAAVSMLAVVGLGLSIILNDGFRSRFPNDVLTIVDGIEIPRVYASDEENAKRGTFPALGSRDSTSSEVDVVIWGDSHALAIGHLADRLAEKYGLSGRIAADSSATPVLNVWRPAAGETGQSKKRWNQHVCDYIRDHRVPNVLLVSRWAMYIEAGRTGQMDNLIVDHESGSVSPTESRKVLLRALSKTVAEIEQSGARVWILAQVPQQDQEPARRLARAAMWGGEHPKGVTLQEHLKQQSNVLDVLSRLPPGHITLDPAPYFFDESGYSRLGDDRKSFYSDDDHVSPHGAEVLLTPVLEPVFAEIAADKAHRHAARTQTKRR